MGVDNTTPGATEDDMGVDNTTSGATEDDMGVDNTTPGATEDDMGVDNTKSQVPKDDIEVDNTTSRSTKDNMEVVNTISGATEDNMGVDNTTSGATEDNMGVDNTTSGATEDNMGVDNTISGATEDNMGVDNTTSGATEDDMGVDNTKSKVPQDGTEVDNTTAQSTEVVTGVEKTTVQSTENGTRGDKSTAQSTEYDTEVDNTTVQSKEDDTGVENITVTSTEVDNTTSKSTENGTKMDSDTAESTEADMRMDSSKSKFTDDNTKVDNGTSGSTEDDMGVDNSKSKFTKDGTIVSNTTALSTENTTGVGSTTALSTDGGTGVGSTTALSTDGGTGVGSTTALSTDGGTGVGITTSLSTDGGTGVGSTTAQSTDGGTGVGSTTAQSTDGGTGVDKSTAQSTQGGTRVDNATIHSKVDVTGVDNSTATSTEDCTGVDNTTSKSTEDVTGMDNNTAPSTEDNTKVASITAHSTKDLMGVDNTTAQSTGGIGMDNITAQSIDGTGEDNTEAQSTDSTGVDNTTTQSPKKDRILDNTTTQSTKDNMRVDTTTSQSTKDITGTESTEVGEEMAIIVLKSPTNDGRVSNTATDGLEDRRGMQENKMKLTKDNPSADNTEIGLPATDEGLETHEDTTDAEGLSSANGKTKNIPDGSLYCPVGVSNHTGSNMAITSEHLSKESSMKMAEKDISFKRPAGSQQMTASPDDKDHNTDKTPTSTGCSKEESPTVLDRKKKVISQYTNITAGLVGEAEDNDVKPIIGTSPGTICQVIKVDTEAEVVKKISEKDTRGNVSDRVDFSLATSGEESSQKDVHPKKKSITEVVTNTGDNNVYKNESLVMTDSVALPRVLSLDRKYASTLDVTAIDNAEHVASDEENSQDIKAKKIIMAIDSLVSSGPFLDEQKLAKNNATVEVNVKAATGQTLESDVETIQCAARNQPARTEREDLKPDGDHKTTDDQGTDGLMGGVQQQSMEPNASEDDRRSKENTRTAEPVRNVKDGVAVGRESLNSASETVESAATDELKEVMTKELAPDTGKSGQCAVMEELKIICDENDLGISSLSDSGSCYLPSGDGDVISCNSTDSKVSSGGVKRSYSISPDTHPKGSNNKKMALARSEQCHEETMTATEKPKDNPCHLSPDKHCPTNAKKSPEDNPRRTSPRTQGCSSSKKEDSSLSNEDSQKRTQSGGKRKEDMSSGSPAAKRSLISPKRKDDRRMGSEQKKLSPGARRKEDKLYKPWRWEGQAEVKPVYTQVEGPPVPMTCYPAIRHDDGDLIRVRDCVLVKSGPRKSDIPYVAKIGALFEDPDTREIMMSVLWFYRAEHTETERLPRYIDNEIFASRHRDVIPAVCIDDKCYVLTFNEFCRYHGEQARTQQCLPPRQNIVPVLDSSELIRTPDHIPPVTASSETVFLCRRVYDVKLKRILKNPQVHIASHSGQ
ncbi:hypothetical protein LSH36_195g03067 [Paralvinella palmiformis]|uniref:BAH domain-containing protein n=1 Tax=Paralvinella palmiformis TaxID=53620 RepID=A0AAD9JPW1_9ANNE|nr:hypothetical protein LSH36_195g03067 [Paralvinella palmiformis]